MKIPELIREKRLSLNESQSEFAMRFGLSHAAISDIERGVSNHLSFDMIELLFADCIPSSEAHRINRLEDKVNELAEMLGRGLLKTNRDAAGSPTETSEKGKQ